MNPSLPSCPCPARALPWLVLAFAAGFPLRAGGEAVPSRSATVQLRQPDTAKRLQAPAAELREGRQLQPAGQIRMSAPVSQVRSGVQDPVTGTAMIDTTGQVTTWAGDVTIPLDAMWTRGW